MAPTKYTRFNALWLQDNEFKNWLIKDETSDKSARCKLCLCSFELSNMGRRAVESHARSKKHMSRAQGGREASTFKAWLQQPKPSSSAGESAHQHSTSDSPDVQCCDASSPSTSATRTSVSSSLTSYLEKEETSKAEILWTLHLVRSHQSFNSSDNMSSLFSAMFHDSAIAKQFTCNRTKCGYLAIHGLAPYFENSP